MTVNIFEQGKTMLVDKTQLLHFLDMTDNEYNTYLSQHAIYLPEINDNGTIKFMVRDIITLMRVFNIPVGTKAYGAKYNLSESTVKRYCKCNLIEGAVKEKGAWRIPINNRPKQINCLQAMCLASQMAFEWKVSVSKLSQYCAKGKMKGAKKVGGKWYIPKNSTNPFESVSDDMFKKHEIDMLVTMLNN